MLEQIDITTTPVLLAQYTWGLDLSHTLDGAGGIGALLAAVDTAGTVSTGDARRNKRIRKSKGDITD